MADRNWLVLCPFCGRAYKPSVWRWIIAARPRGVLAMGQPRSEKGRFLSPDKDIINAIELNRVMEEIGFEAETSKSAQETGFFKLLKARLLQIVKNWLGHGWLTAEEFLKLFPRLVKIYAGFPVGNFGPGYIENRLVKRDKQSPIWMFLGKTVKKDHRDTVWG